jgi:hypothetical protein
VYGKLHNSSTVPLSGQVEIGVCYDVASHTERSQNMFRTCLGALGVLIAVLFIIFAVGLLVEEIKASPHLFDSTIPSYHDFPGLEEEFRGLTDATSLDWNKDLDWFLFHGDTDYRITIEVWPSYDLRDNDDYLQTLCPLVYEIVDRHISDDYDVDVVIDKLRSFSSSRPSYEILCE